MREFVAHSKITNKDLVFTYNDDDDLINVAFPDTMTLKGWKLTLENFPITISQLAEWQKQFTGLTIEETIAITFDRFWDLYNYKKGRLNAEKEWRKLNEADKMKATVNVSKYNRSLMGKTTEKLYAERYLKYRRFDDEF